MRIVLVAAVLLAGCAIGNKYRYHQSAATLGYQGGGPVQVAVLDRRPYVVSGDKPPHFVGLQRGGFGNPFSVGTESGRPMADDMAESLAATLDGAGYQTEVVTLAPGGEIEAAQRGLKGRAVLLVLEEWKSDTASNVALIYDVALFVLEDGQPAATARAQGRDNLGGSLWNPPAHARREVPRAVAEKLRELLSMPEISGALR